MLVLNKAEWGFKLEYPVLLNSGVIKKGSGAVLDRGEVNDVVFLLFLWIASQATQRLLKTRTLKMGCQYHWICQDSWTAYAVLGVRSQAALQLRQNVIFKGVSNGFRHLYLVVEPQTLKSKKKLTIFSFSQMAKDECLSNKIYSPVISLFVWQQVLTHMITKNNLTRTMPLLSVKSKWGISVHCFTHRFFSRKQMSRNS